MKKLAFSLILVALVAALLAGTIHAAQVIYKLMAGQSMHVGRVVVADDGVNLTVTFSPFDGYCLNETHVHVADSLDGIPQKNGNPRPGRFDHKGDHDCETGMVRYTMPLDWGDGPPLYIAAHAVVGMVDDPLFDETGWGVLCGQMERFAFPGRNWAVYIEYPHPGPP